MESQQCVEDSSGNSMIINNFSDHVISNDDQVNHNTHVHKSVRILHFNDCYDVEPRQKEPKGGAARFKTALNQFRDENTLVLFSGDIVGPSLLSTVTKGIHMVPVLNECHVDCAVLGNHDFDFGVDNLTTFIKQTKFDWLISNVIDKETMLPLGNAKQFKILERNGFKFGLVGLVEEEWLVTLAAISKDDVIFTDYVLEGRRLARFLRQTHNVDYVIALTHMRMPNDMRLAEQVAEIDLILGGHDHDYECLKVNDKHVIKSGTDFREFSVIDLKRTVNSENPKPDAECKFNLTVRKVDVNSNEYVEDPELKQQLDSYSGLVGSRLDTVLGYFGCDLDCRFSQIRTKETRLSNFVTDIMLAATHADMALLNSGTFRSDRIHEKGPFKLRDLFQVLPQLSPLTVIQVTGHQIWKALENGVSQYPKLEGRFPQVAGVRFAFNPDNPSGNRIELNHIHIGDQSLDLNRNYRLVTKSFVHSGKDGYDVLKGSKVLVPEDECVNLTYMVQNHFEAINKFLQKKLFPNSHQHQSLISLIKKHLTTNEFDKKVELEPKEEGRIVKMPNVKV